jgi:hypothetical protein
MPRVHRALDADRSVRTCGSPTHREDEAPKGGQARQEALFLVDEGDVAADPACPPPPAVRPRPSTQTAFVRSELAVDESRRVVHRAARACDPTSSPGATEKVISLSTEVRPKS